MLVNNAGLDNLIQFFGVILGLCLVPPFLNQGHILGLMFSTRKPPPPPSKVLRRDPEEPFEVDKDVRLWCLSHPVHRHFFGPTVKVSQRAKTLTYENTSDGSVSTLSSDNEAERLVFNYLRSRDRDWQWSAQNRDDSPMRVPGGFKYNELDFYRFNQDGTWDGADAKLVSTRLAQWFVKVSPSQQSYLERHRGKLYILRFLPVPYRKRGDAGYNNIRTGYEIYEVGIRRFQLFLPSLQAHVSRPARAPRQRQGGGVVRSREGPRQVPQRVAGVLPRSRPKRRPLVRKIPPSMR